ncbi:YugN family protein [Gracilibacillus kekensis]|uniref:YugN-like family protein n=1 Tax=Gracilibacillus kekensis TaxID=1027249 RepID=A0A1M7M9Z9_9BACI|nr:YugN family protein [Gracilibacillus kekensis]SHM87633.1 YugN-like family protein [Gracilibacillus kekensis]
MKITDTGIEDNLIDLKPLDHAMEKANFVRAGQWDYERVTYDYKIGSPEKNITYYIRVQGYAVEGDVDKGDAVIKLLTPLLGKHYYPTGIEYGEKEEFPPTTVERASTLLKNAKQNFEPFVKN